jgi:NAD(P)-dependent dehydrogenase (short-subunit alcohol dehydrogenase family)
MALLRTALISGANRGIGLATAQGLAARGDVHVLLAARHMEDAAKAAASLGKNVTAVQLDLSSHAIRGAQIAQILAAHPVIDILVNNAGVLEHGALLSLPEDVLSRSLEVNFLGPLDLVRALVPLMVQRGYGRIVNLSSGWGSFSDGLNGPPAYAMTKAALNGLTLSLSHELPANVKINSCCPGWVRTRMGGSGATKSVEDGADTPIWLATLPDDGPSGGFFRNRKPIAW